MQNNMLPHHSLFIVYCLLTIHKTYNIYKGEEGLIKTIDAPLTIKMFRLMEFESGFMG